MKLTEERIIHANGKVDKFYFVETKKGRRLFDSKRAAKEFYDERIIKREYSILEEYDDE